MRAAQLVGVGLLIVAALGGGYYVSQTNRKSGPRWDRLHPELQAKALQLEQLAAAQGLPVMFWEGWRSPQASAANIAAGTSKVKDPLNSLHVWGEAMDIVFKNAAGMPYWPPATDPRWKKLAQLGQSLGLFSGGLAWGWDWPHFQRRGVSAAQLRARHGSNFLAYVQGQRVLA